MVPMCWGGVAGYGTHTFNLVLSCDVLCINYYVIVVS